MVPSTLLSVRISQPLVWGFFLALLCSFWNPSFPTQPETEPGPTTTKAKNSNHWTTREFPEQPFLKHFLAQESDGYSQGQEPFPALSEHLALFSSLKKIQYKTRQTIHKEAKFSCCSVSQSCLALCNPMDCSTPGSSVLHYLPEFAHSCPLSW